MKRRSETRLNPRVRPRLLVILFLCCAMLACLLPVKSWFDNRSHAYFPLYQETIAIGVGGEVVEIAPGSSQQLVDGTRVLRGVPDADRYAREQLDWLAAGRVPSIPELGSSTMVRNALLDLHLLSSQHGVAVAGWTEPWRHVWPRDSAFVAAALASTGHLDDAESLLFFLADRQPSHGVFAARYKSDRSGVPDARGDQLDGLGWALWGLRQVAMTVPQPERSAFVERHRKLLDTSSSSIILLIDNDMSMPPVSADYWETKVTKRTLATSAALLAGLESAAQLYASANQPEQSASAAAAMTRLRYATYDAFADDGFPRLLGGSADSVDLGVSFLLPPFSEQLDPGALAAWRGSAAMMSRTAGGLAPGGSWRRDGVSWTPATANYALVAAALGERETAISYLQWLDQHRTSAGSIPEKILFDGSPASVAPLGWSSALVILTVASLEPASLIYPQYETPSQILRIELDSRQPLAEG